MKCLKEHGKVLFVKVRTASEVLLYWLTASLNLKQSGNDVVRLAKTNGQSLFYGRNCPDLSGHNVFEYEMRRSLGTLCWLLGDSTSI